MSEATEPAFPQHDVGGETSWPGMPLRYWFAGKIMPSMITLYEGDHSKAAEYTCKAVDDLIRALEVKS
ncbi:hypothetical protein [Thalassospira lohafexi]|uniref:Uncharacterized protein n=1 Tax=Thalassospira lohafexi TaxID=744227 RepID=A0A2N3L0V9_9PROT|nr:hypothetical protein [Thalassospira lohafexi]PKR56377.1 hypothetical protein COO92_21470 [Thalassospira lohafexi]